MTLIAAIQRRVGVDDDGKIGTTTIAAIARALGIKAELADPAAFFAKVRPMFGGKLSQAQADGINTTIAAFAAVAAPIAHVAYGLATKQWETAQTMQPIDEIGKGKGRTYGKPGRNGGQVPYGRGDVQLTHDVNYEKADAELGLNGALIANYDLAKRPDIAARIMVEGMAEGWFTGKAFHDYLPSARPATTVEFRDARRIINGTDRAMEIAGLAIQWQAALTAGRWA